MRIYPIVSLALVLSAVDATHSSTSHSHARRSLTKRLQRRDLLDGPPGAVGSNVKGPSPTQSNDPDTNATTTTATDKGTITITSQVTLYTTAASPTSSADGNQQLLGITSVLPATSVSPRDLGGILPPLLSSILDPNPTPAPNPTGPGSSSGTPAPTTSEGGGILPPILSSILNPDPDPTPTPNPSSGSSSSSGSAAPTSSDPGGILPPILSSVLNPAPSSTPAPSVSAPSSSDAPASSSQSGILPPILSSILNPNPSSSAPPSSITPAPSSSGGGGLPSIISSILAPPSSSGPVPSSSAPPPAPSTTGGGIVSSILSSVLNPPSTSVQLPPSSVTSEPHVPPSSVPPSSVPPSSVPPSSVPPSSVPPSSVPPSSVPPSITTGPSGNITTSPSPSITSDSSIIISFPTAAPSSNGSITAGPPTGVTSGVANSTATTTISINSDFSFILSESSLIFATITPTPTPTLADPDQATTTVPTQTKGAPATTLTVAPLPTGIPARIYPSKVLDMSQNLRGHTLISVLFNAELNWPFVVDNQISSSQIFAYLPSLIGTAIGDADVKTWVLQVYIPSSYQSPADAVQLGTMWLGYIKSDLVSTLAAEIKAPQSTFYTGTNDNVARALASRVNSGFNLLSVADPNLGSGSGSSSSPNGANGAAGNGSGQARQDAIIGVVTTIGAIAVLVLGFLIYRSYKRKQELSHRRLSDPIEIPGARPEGREFDQDSVGGARRRSFYFAEDSLRGYQAEQQRASQAPSASTMGGMVQRRAPLGTSAISAPVLGDNTMNW